MHIPTSAAELAATRRLIGLSAIELATALAIKRGTVHEWERGRFTPSIGVREDIAALRERHDTALAEMIAYHDAEGGVIGLPRHPMPPSWYLALGARLIDARPDAQLSWTTRQRRAS